MSAVIEKVISMLVSKVPGENNDFQSLQRHNPQTNGFLRMKWALQGFVFQGSNHFRWVRAFFLQAHDAQNNGSYFPRRGGLDLCVHDLRSDCVCSRQRESEAAGAGWFSDDTFSQGTFFALRSVAKRFACFAIKKARIQPSSPISHHRTLFILTLLGAKMFSWVFHNPLGWGPSCMVIEVHLTSSVASLDSQNALALRSRNTAESGSLLRVSIWPRTQLRIQGTFSAWGVEWALSPL